MHVGFSSLQLHFNMFCGKKTIDSVEVTLLIPLFITLSLDLPFSISVPTVDLPQSAQQHYPYKGVFGGFSFDHICHC